MYEARFARATPVKVMPADAGFQVALAYPRDVYHRRVFKALRKRRDEELDTTGLVLTETVRLIGQRYAESGALQFLANVAVGAGQVVNVPSDALGHLRAFTLKCCGLKADLADASLVWLAEELGEGGILSADLCDFGTRKCKSHKPFEDFLFWD